MNREDIARLSRTDAARRHHPHVDRSYIIPVLSKALLILDMLRNSERPLNVAGISANTGIAKSTVYRILRTLSAYGYLPNGAEGIYSFRRIPPLQKQVTYSRNGRVTEQSTSCVAVEIVGELKKEISCANSKVGLSPDRKTGKNRMSLE